MDSYLDEDWSPIDEDEYLTLTLMKINLKRKE